MNLINVERLGQHSIIYAFDPNHHFFECGELERLKNNLNFATNGAAVVMSERTMFSRGIVVVFCNPTNSRYYTRDLVDDVVISYLSARQEEPDEDDAYDAGHKDEDEECEYGKEEECHKHRNNDENLYDYDDEAVWDKYEEDEFDEAYDAENDEDSEDDGKETPKDNCKDDKDYDIIDEDYEY